MRRIELFRFFSISKPKRCLTRFVCRKALDLLSGWEDLCETYGCSKGNLVIAFTAARAFPIHVLVGARTPEQVEDNAHAMSVSLSAEDLARMEADLQALDL